MRTMRPYLLAFCCVCLLVTGQSLWKHALGRRHAGFEVNRRVFSAMLNLASDPYIIAGMVAYVCATALWFEVLSKMALSKAFPLMSVSYVMALVVGRLVFDERISWAQVAGVLLICSGVALAARK